MRGRRGHTDTRRYGEEWNIGGARVDYALVPRSYTALAAAFFACVLGTAGSPPDAAAADPVAAESGASRAIAAWVDSAIAPADGFELPARRGDRRVVRAIGRGRVREVEADRVVVEHVYYVNHEKKALTSIYGPLSEVTVQAGAKIERGAVLGKSNALRLELQPAVADANVFIEAHKSLFVPQDEPVLVVVDQASYRMAIYHRGRLQKHVEIGLGQAKGAKIEQGDLKTPKGMYFITEKRSGEFSGRFGGYYGGHWMKINYPNAFDADRAFEAGWIDKARAQKISADWRARKLTDQKTRLGGGIGFHGWIEEWDGTGGAHLSWGCVVVHLFDVEALYAMMPAGAMVVIL